MRATSFRKTAGVVTPLLAVSSLVIAAAYVDSTEKPLPASMLSSIWGANVKNQQRVDFHTCEQHTVGEFSVASEPDKKKMVENVVYACDQAAVNGNKKCWKCDNQGVVHEVYASGGEVGYSFEGQDCGPLSEGVCKIVLGEPRCADEAPVQGYGCSVAYYGEVQSGGVN